MSLHPEIRAAVEAATIAHVATVAEEGWPHVVPVWIGRRGEQLVFLTGPDSRKARNLRRDPRLALSMTAPDNPFHPLIVRGRVVEWLTGDDGWAVVDELATKYTGGPYPRGAERVVAVIDPEHQSAGVG